MSKTIQNHPLCAEVESWPDSDYRYHVKLIEGYRYAGYGSTIRGFHTVKDALDALRFGTEKGEAL